MQVKPVKGSRNDTFEIAIATANNRNRKKWSSKIMTWGDLKERLSRPDIKPHTRAEYERMTKEQQTEAKDVGGFVGGSLKDGTRQTGQVAWRTLITFDLDEPRAGFMDNLGMLFNYETAIYSTHSHTREKPRYRVIFPLKQPITEEQYAPVARMLAFMVDIESVDPKSFDAIQMMFWPSMPSDVEYVYETFPGKLLDPQDVFKKYANKGLDWQDAHQWPRSEKENKEIRKTLDRAQNPLEKKGWVGAFCAAYSIDEAIETFLPDVYVPFKDERYTYTEGTSAGGLVVYEDGLFAYSHHSTDPICNRLVNAFDLVRIHKHGGADKDAKEGTPPARMPSFMAMVEALQDDSRVREILTKQQMADAADDFADGALDWVGLIKKDKNGKTLQTIENALTILENDEGLKGKLGTNAFLGMPSIKGALPWRGVSEMEFANLWTDTDFSYLQKRVEAYGYTSVQKLQTSLGIVFDRNKYHPVQDYLRSLTWDGKKRVESLLIDYLGAEDCGGGYTQTVTKKALLSCVYRVMKPGYKVDTMLVLVGEQGIGKSTILAKLGGRWFSDSLDSIKGKDAYGQLRGAWLIEVGEMTATRKADNEDIKRFLTKTQDVYRASYDRYESSVPRQCVFFGSTNDYDFLNDPTGNRRFWPVLVGQQPIKKDIWKDLTEYEINQVWAEAYKLYEGGDSITLSKAMQKIAEGVQQQHTQENPMAGMIRDFVNKEYPVGYLDADKEGVDFLKYEYTGPTEKLDRVCPALIWVECLGRKKSELKPYEARNINQIMDNVPGFERASGLSFGRYGRQKGHRRSITGGVTDVTN